MAPRTSNDIAPVVVRGREYESSLVTTSAYHKIDAPISKEDALQRPHRLNPLGTRTISLWVRDDGRTTALERRFNLWRWNFDIIHHDLAAGRDHVFRQFPILERWNVTRNMNIGARLVISQAVN